MGTTMGSGAGAKVVGDAPQYDVFGNPLSQQQLQDYAVKSGLGGIPAGYAPTGINGNVQTGATGYGTSQSSYNTPGYPVASPSPYLPTPKAGEVDPNRTSPTTPQYSAGGEIGGMGSMTQSGYEAQQQMILAQKLRAQDEARRLSYLSSGAAGSSPHVSGGMQPDETAARNAAFAQAKEMAGQNGMASLKALQDVMANNGLSGSSMETRGMGGIIGGVGAGVNDTIQNMLQADLQRAQGISDRTYQGDITQRGQDLSRLSTILGSLSTGSTGIY